MRLSPLFALDPHGKYSVEHILDTGDDSEPSTLCGNSLVRIIASPSRANLVFTGEELDSLAEQWLALRKPKIGFKAGAEKNHLSLKWGTIKSYSVSGNDKAIELIKRYDAIGVSDSGVMTQHDTPEQKQIICDLIDTMPGEIYLELAARYVSKDDAKKYVLEYGHET